MIVAWIASTSQKGDSPFQFGLILVGQLLDLAIAERTVVKLVVVDLADEMVAPTAADAILVLPDHDAVVLNFVEAPITAQTVII